MWIEFLFYREERNVCCFKPSEASPTINPEFHINARGLYNIFSFRGFAWNLDDIVWLSMFFESEKLHLITKSNAMDLWQLWPVLSLCNILLYIGADLIFCSRRRIECRSALS